MLLELAAVVTTALDDFHLMMQGGIIAPTGQPRVLPYLHLEGADHSSSPLCLRLTFDLHPCRGRKRCR